MDISLDKIEDFTIIRAIGEGAMGQILLTKHKETGKNYALKLMEDSTDINMWPTIRALKLIQDISHPNFMRCYNDFTQIYNGKFYTVSVMEYITGNDLYNCVVYFGKHYVTSRIDSIITQLFEALKYLKEHDFVHRDIKLENIMYTSDNKIKLIDYDFFTKVGVFRQERCGTPYYIAPEIIEFFRNPNRVGVPPYSNKSDIWAAGVALYCIYSDTYPFDGNTYSEMYDNILNDNPPMDIVPEKYRDIISGMLEKNSDLRSLNILE